jgi:hypothetical protein
LILLAREDTLDIELGMDQLPEFFLNDHFGGHGAHGASVAGSSQFDIGCAVFDPAEAHGPLMGFDILLDGGKIVFDGDTEVFIAERHHRRISLVQLIADKFCQNIAKDV